MDGYDQKFLSSSSPTMVPTGNKHAVTRTYPKKGQEQSIGSLDIQPDSPKGSAVTVTYGKSGQKQSL